MAVPLLDGDGVYLGTLCALDPEAGSDLKAHVGVLGQLSRLISQQLRLEDTERDRNLFIGMLAHDLRNPLNSLVIQQHVALSDPDLSHSTRRSLEESIKKIEQMSSLTTELLEFARLRSGVPLDLRRDLLNLDETAREVSIQNFSVAERERISISSSGDPQFLGDAGRLSQILQNLLANALRHAPPKTPVTVRILGDDPDRVRMEIHNLGEPIPAEAQALLFEPFRGSTSSDSGRGLGLFIVSKLVAAHNGSVAVASDRVEGTTFCIELPRQNQLDVT